MRVINVIFLISYLFGAIAALVTGHYFECSVLAGIGAIFNEVLEARRLAEAAR